MTPARILVALFAAGVALAGPAQAQAPVKRTETVAPGKSVRIVVAANLKQDCSAGPVPEIKVTSGPKNGSLTTKAGKTKTPASYRCPNKEAAVQAMFYQSKPDFTGSDAVTLDIKTADGKTETREISITVKAGEPDAKKDEKKDATDL